MHRGCRISKDAWGNRRHRYFQRFKVLIPITLNHFRCRRTPITSFNNGDRKDMLIGADYPIHHIVVYDLEQEPKAALKFPYAFPHVLHYVVDEDRYQLEHETVAFESQIAIDNELNRRRTRTLTSNFLSLSASLRRWSSQFFGC